MKRAKATFTGSLGSAFPGMIDKSYNAEGYRPYAKAIAAPDSDNDGMPDAWEKAHGLDPKNPEDRNQTNQEGYTALEIYMASLMGERINCNFVSHKK